MSIRSSLLDPLTGAAESSSKMIGNYIIPREMSGLTMNGQPRRGTPADTDCIYCRNEVDVVTTYGTVVTPQRKCPQQRRPLVVAGLDADRTCGCGMSPDRAVTAAQWPVMTTTECADSGDSRTPSINVDDDLFLSLPCRTSAYYQR